jgi:hypothetical protein
MGLGNGSGGSVTWLQVKEGAFVKGRKDEVQETHKSLTGTVTGIEFRDKEYNGNTWREAVLSVTDDGATFKFGLGVGSGYGKQLLSKVALADVNKPMTFEPTYSEKDGKKSSGFFVTQGKALKQLWTRDNPNGMPQMTSIVFKGKTQWDDSEQVAFIEKYYTENVIPKLTGAPPATASSSSSEHVERESGDDDIPF